MQYECTFHLYQIEVDHLFTSYCLPPIIIVAPKGTGINEVDLVGNEVEGVEWCCGVPGGCLGTEALVGAAWELVSGCLVLLN